MKRLFLDTNVVLDLLLARAHFAENAALLFNYAALGQAALYISALSFPNMHYILHRYGKKDSEILSALQTMRRMVTIVALTDKHVDVALYNSHPDFEDALQYQAALSVPGLDGIVTRNERDFQNTTIPILNPPAAVALFTHP